MLTNGNGNGIPATMLVGPAGYGYGNNGGGLFGGDITSILVLFFLFMMMGGWGGMGGFGGYGMDGGLYPWLNNSQHISDGFWDQQLNTQVGDLRSDVNRGFGDVQLGLDGVNQNICQTGNGITQALNNGFNGAEIAANGRQMANMQQMFGLQSQIAQGNCDNRAAALENRYVLAQEACNTRQNSTDNTQKILDKLCQLELDGVRRQVADEQRENANLRSENQYLRNQAERTAQTALFERGLNNEVDALYNRLKNCPVNTVPVAGNTPLFSCNPSFNTPGGCGCGV